MEQTGDISCKHTIESFEILTQTINYLADSRDGIVADDFAERLGLVVLMADEPGTEPCFRLAVAHVDVCGAVRSSVRRGHTMNTVELVAIGSVERPARAGGLFLEGVDHVEL